MITIIRRLLRHYTFDLKLKNKLVISHALLILVPTAILSGLFFVKLYGIVLDDSIRSEQVLSAQTASSVESLISHVNYVSDALSESASIHRLFYVTPGDADEINPQMDWITDLFRLTDSLTSQSSITGIRIYYNDSVYPDLSAYNTDRNPLFAPVSSVKNSHWYSLFHTSRVKNLLCPKAYLNPSEAKRYGGLAYIVKVPFLPPGGDGDKPDASAFLAVYLNEEYLLTMLQSNARADGETTYLINSNNVVVSSSRPLSGKRLIPKDQLIAGIGEPGHFVKTSYSAGMEYAAYYPIRDTDWYLVSLLPASSITDAGAKLMLQMIGAYLLFTAAALIIALKLSGSIADRIIAVAYQMESVRTGRPIPLEVPETGCDEIGVLTDTYNYMTEEINELMDIQKKSSDDLRMAEFRALQAQINPHFLYNTLDMINWLSRRGRNEEVSKAIRTLSRFYKLTLSKKGLMNTIEEELKHTELYVELQNMRYDNCVSFVVDVPDELSDYTIPKLTFQPIVENAWLHGIMGTEEKRGNILLTGWPEGTDIIFLISDNGVGISPKRLTSVLDNKNGTHPEGGSSDSAHIGIYNTNLRLKRLYGESYGLTLLSHPGEGTEVSIRIPASRREEGAS